MKIEEALKTNRFESERHKATLNVMYTAYWLKTHFNTVVKENGITAEQYNILRILRGKYPQKMCVKDIGSRMIEKNSNVPRIIDRLIIKKLVVRGPSAEDKRETLVSLTDKGIDILHTCSKRSRDINESILGLSDDEAIQLNSLLEKMRLVD